MGTSIFLYLNHYDYRLSWLCSSESAKLEAQRLFSKKMTSKLHCGVLSEEEYTLKMAQTVITEKLPDLKDCDLIIEAIPEDLELKRKMFMHLDQIVKTDCIFTTNSSSILPSQLFPSEGRKNKTIGLHFFFPVQLKKFVELITTAQSSSLVKEKLHHFLEEIQKIPFCQDENHSFILNRLFLDFQAGAYQIYEEGRLSYKEIDDLVKEHLFPFGVFEFFDHVGIDVMLASVRAYTDDALNQDFYAPLVAKMEELARLRHLGIKTKQGFYDYSTPTKNQTLAMVKDELQEPYHREVAERLRNYFLNSVKTVLESGFITADELAEAIKDYTGMDKDPFI